MPDLNISRPSFPGAKEVRALDEADRVCAAPDCYAIPVMNYRNPLRIFSMDGGRPWPFGVFKKF